MRWLLLFLLFPFAAQAADTHITVEYLMTQERLTPTPIIIHPHITVQLVLHEDGTVDDYSHIPGPYAQNTAHASRLGEQRVKVVNSHTITRSWSTGPQQRKLTVVHQRKQLYREIGNLRPFRIRCILDLFEYQGALPKCACR